MEMSDGESIIFIFHGLIALVIWGQMLRVLLENSPLQELRGLKGLVCCAPLVLALMLLVLLQFFAASDVRGSIYLFFYLTMGGAWVGLAIWAVSILGIDFRDDVDESQNPAAIIFYLGAMVGFTLAFAGSNFGEGPSWTVVAYCSILSMGSLLLLWVTVAKLTGAIDTISIDWDTPTGFRLACLFVACGAVLGRSVAGDWEGPAGAFQDFAQHLLPLALIATAETVLGSLVRPRPGSESLYPAPVLRGVLPGIVYIGFAAWYLVLVGWW